MKAPQRYVIGAVVALSCLLAVAGPEGRTFAWPLAVAVTGIAFVAIVRGRLAQSPVPAAWRAFALSALGVVAHVTINALAREGVVSHAVSRPLALAAAAISITAGGYGSTRLCRPLLASSVTRRPAALILAVVVVSVVTAAAASIPIRDWQQDVAPNHLPAVVMVACAAALAGTWSWARRIGFAADRPVEVVLIGIPLADIGGHGLAQLVSHEGPLAAGSWLGPLWAMGIALVAAIHPAFPRAGAPLGHPTAPMPLPGLADAVAAAIVLAPVATWAAVNEGTRGWVLAAGAGVIVLEGFLLTLVARPRLAERAATRAGPPRVRQLRRDLARAFDRDELEMHYQPVHRAGSGALAGAEALARWRHPSLGVLAAAEFVPLAEASGYGDALDAWALRAVLGDLKIVHDAIDDDDPYVAVNFSPRQLERAGFVDWVADQLESTNVSARGLVIELTEMVAVTDWDQLAANLVALQVLGFQIAVDDFGSGHANLKYLSRLDPDIIKLDRDLIVAAATSGRGHDVVHSSVALAKTLGVLVVAEGVEDAAWGQMLGDLGVDYLQGYALGHPTTARLFPRSPVARESAS